jgi:hypothetical protein
VPFAGEDGGGGVVVVVVAGEMIFLSISPYGESVMTSMAALTIAVPNPSKILIL